MKIAIIGANGNLGKRVVRQALDRGFDVKGFIYNGDSPDDRIEIIKKSLFDLTKEDVAECEAIISAYGSGFKADPTLNYQAFQKYIELCKGSKIHLIAIGGAGSLYTNGTHLMYCYEAPNYSETLKEISRNIELGIDELKKTSDVNWTVVCPSEFFDPEGSFTRKYQIGTEGHLIYNEEGKSYVTYDDLAMAMIDIAEDKSYSQMQITIGTKSCM